MARKVFAELTAQERECHLHFLLCRLRSSARRNSGEEFFLELLRSQAFLQMLGVIPPSRKKRLLKKVVGWFVSRNLISFSYAEKLSKKFRLAHE